MSRYLLDTHIVLWLADDTEKLSEEVLAILSDYENQIYFSPINLWEIVIKNRQSHQDFDVNVKRLHQQLLVNDFVELHITSDHVKQIEGLPLHHKDPFDRMLIAQAMNEKFCLISQDTMMAHYEGLQLLKN